MHNSASLIASDIDYERTGLQTGTLRLPYSHDRSAYGHVPIPVAVLNAGPDTGPTVLLTGGNHGDEYEGPIALMKLMRRLPAMSIRGRLIVIPGLNFPAFANGTRTSPIDKGNLNRLFPGARNGSPTEMIAHYVETELLPRADVVIDLHAGGASVRSARPVGGTPRNRLPQRWHGDVHAHVRPSGTGRLHRIARQRQSLGLTRTAPIPASVISTHCMSNRTFS